MKQKELIIRENIRSGRNHNDRFSIFFSGVRIQSYKKRKTQLLSMEMAFIAHTITT